MRSHLKRTRRRRAPRIVDKRTQTTEKKETKTRNEKETEKIRKKENFCLEIADPGNLHSQKECIHTQDYEEKTQMKKRNTPFSSLEINPRVSMGGLHLTYV